MWISPPQYHMQKTHGTNFDVVYVSSLQVIPYWLAQMVGAFVSAVVVYGVYIGKCALQPSYCLSLDHPPGLKRDQGRL